jgi:hypothetical protein
MTTTTKEATVMADELSPADAYTATFASMETLVSQEQALVRALSMRRNKGNRGLQYQLDRVRRIMAAKKA